MKSLLIILLFLFTFGADGQINNPAEADPYKSEIKKDILRLSLIVLMPYDDGWPLTFSYERQIAVPFTALLKAGPVFKHDTFGDGNKADRFFLSGYGSAELRYYFNLKRRIRKEKLVRNFTASYLSIEQQALTGSLVTVNVNTKREGRTFTYLNMGHQRQFKRGYFNAFFGPTIQFKQGVLEVEEYHIGLAFGIVLFD